MQPRPLPDKLTYLFQNRGECRTRRRLYTKSSSFHHIYEAVFPQKKFHFVS